MNLCSSACGWCGACETGCPDCGQDHASPSCEDLAEAEEFERYVEAFEAEQPVKLPGLAKCPPSAPPARQVIA